MEVCYDYLLTNSSIILDVLPHTSCWNITTVLHGEICYHYFLFTDGEGVSMRLSSMPKTLLISVEEFGVEIGLLPLNYVFVCLLAYLLHPTHCLCLVSRTVKSTELPEHVKPGT